MTTNLHPYFAHLFTDSGTTDLSGGPDAVAQRRRNELCELMIDTPRTPVTRVSDLVIPATPRPIPARLYHPRPQDTNVPLSIFAHGGGWIAGDLETHDSICRRLAVTSQHAVLAFDYRLAPEDPYPAGLNDTISTLNWSIAAGHQLGVDTSLGIALVGESSGANLVLAAILAVGSETREAIRALVLTHPPLQPRVDLPSHVAYGDGYGLTNKTIEYLWDVYVPHPTDRKQPTVSPLEARSYAGMPPTLIQLAEFDPLRSEGEELALRMRREGLEVTSIIYREVPHGFQTAFHRVPQAAKSIADAANFLRAIESQNSHALGT